MTRWVPEPVSIEGGWHVRCRLCGRLSRRTFMGERTNYAEALREAEEYSAEHLQSEEHKAALTAFHRAEHYEVPRNRSLIAEIFGERPPTEMQLRREAAHAAARTTARSLGRRWR